MLNMLFQSGTTSSEMDQSHAPSQGKVWPIDRKTRLSATHINPTSDSTPGRLSHCGGELTGSTLSQKPLPRIVSARHVSGLWKDCLRTLKVLYRVTQRAQNRGRHFTRDEMLQR